MGAVDGKNFFLKRGSFQENIFSKKTRFLGDIILQGERSIIGIIRQYYRNNTHNIASESILIDFWNHHNIGERWITRPCYP
jgi:tRNA A22 N-methylase